MRNDMEAVGMMIYFDDARAMFPALSQEEKGDLFDALLTFGETGEEYNGGNDKVYMTFRLMATKIIRDQQKLADKREKYRQNRLGKSVTIDNNGAQSLSIDNHCKGSAYNSNSTCNSTSNSKSKNYKDTRNVNPDGLTDADSYPDGIQQSIESIVSFMDTNGFDYSSCHTKDGIRGLLGKYLCKNGRDPSEIITAVQKALSRKPADRNKDDDTAYMIRCLEH